jgi:peptidoglycan hydrolase-like protein with peptidoglycan-binding domain
MVSRAYNTVVRQLGDLEEFEQETGRELKQREEEPKKQALDPETAVATTGPVVPPAPAPAKELTSDEVYNNAMSELSLLTGPGGGNQVRNYKEIQKLLRKVKSQIRREQAKGLSLDEQTSQSDSLGKLRALRKKLETLLSNAETIKDEEGKEIKKISADAIEASIDSAPDVADDGPTVDPIRVVGKMPRKRRRVSSLARKARIQRKLNNRLGLTMNKIQAAVGAEETGKYDRETYREILDFQKENLPPTRKTKRGKIVNNHDGLVGPVTLAKLKSKFSDWASVGQSRDKKPSTPGISTKLDKTLKVGNKESWIKPLKLETKRLPQKQNLRD